MKLYPKGNRKPNIKGDWNPWDYQSPFVLISSEQISGIDLVFYVIESWIISVCYDAAAHLLELLKVINYFRAKKRSSVL